MLVTLGSVIVTMGSVTVTRGSVILVMKTRIAALPYILWSLGAHVEVDHDGDGLEGQQELAL